MRIAAAATLYFAIVFAAGFLLGPIRVLWLEPRVGAVVATLCEAPFLIAAMVLAARWVPRVTQLRRDFASLAMMGIGALALQQIADLGVGVGLRRMSLSEQLAQLASTPGLIYVALLAMFVVMPLLLNRRSDGADTG